MAPCSAAALVLMLLVCWCGSSATLGFVCGPATVVTMGKRSHSHSLYPTAVASTARVSTPTMIASLFQGKKSSSVGNKLVSAKEALMTAIKPLQRGLTASDADMERIEGLARTVEKLNPTRNPLASPELSAKWELVYTTSAEIQGKNRPAFLRPTGPIYQTINTTTLKARNEEKVLFLIPNAVNADLIPKKGSNSFVNVQFTKFFLGPVSFKAPESARGALDTTFLDSDMRISRGDKGNLFVLTK